MVMGKAGGHHERFFGNCVSDSVKNQPGPVRMGKGIEHFDMSALSVQEQHDPSLMGRTVNTNDSVGGQYEKVQKKGWALGRVAKYTAAIVGAAVIGWGIGCGVNYMTKDVNAMKYHADISSFKG